jgi:ABC-type phosphate transport system substrate-binding protein
MGSRQGSIVARRPLAAASLLALLALLVTGCGGHSNVQFASSGSPATGVSTGGSVSVQGSTALGTLLAIGVLAGASYHGDHVVPPGPRVPEMDPARRVVEVDCTRPIEDWSANLRCR